MTQVSIRANLRKPRWWRGTKAINGVHMVEGHNENRNISR